MDETRIQDRGEAGTIDPATLHEKAPPHPRFIEGGVGTSLRHDSGAKHVSGQARYVDDDPELPGTLHIYLAMAQKAHARIVSMDLAAVRAAPGVVAVLTAADIPGRNDYSPVFGDDPIFAEESVSFLGQPLFAVAGETLKAARAAAGLARVAYEEKPAAITLDEALALGGEDLLPPHTMRLGEPEAVLAAAPHRIAGRVETGGQDHFYLEGQIATAVPLEDGDVLVRSSTQHPSEVQHNVAKALGVPDHAVTVEVRRMGGGFGGKESQPALFAAVCALVAVKTGRPAKCRLDRDDDMEMTGKRHEMRADYDFGFDEEGRILAADLKHFVRCGYSRDLSGAIADRAMFHADNAYALHNARIHSRRLKTHTASNTAFRGFGGPQGMVAVERALDRIAHEKGLDPLDVRKRNFYPAMGSGVEARTPYHMAVTDCVIAEIVEELEDSSDYRARRRAVRAFNAQSPVLKKGLALTPVKFGISFTTTHLNQAGALVHLYKDGSVQLNHGGTEMGQGLFTKVAQVVAEEFQIDVSRIRITATTTAKVPNTSATAASSGSDLNGMAAREAARTIKERLADYAVRRYRVPREEVEFLPGRVRIGETELSFDDLVGEAYLARVSLSSTGFYATPGISYDRDTASGTPFYYFAYGAACSEVVIDTLTGENRVIRADILHDVGRSLNPALDLGQIEGGFIQGMGWLTMEELWWDKAGRLRTHAPSTYKIPTANDRPDDLRIALWDKGRNPAATIYRSKAVGEPPFMLALSVFSALGDAVLAAGDHRAFPDLDAPATPERILAAVDMVRAAR
ncbi:xanthine dehydrogenase molybdopterin binding subunit [Aureimonas populi]|uniref:Xanthine dehydrogenase molybdopterin binding subunit n=1 Tax=Aureimonas populi TaxID=1701758 RepID=A0ABW5CM73_9HYPH|nr:xanthine dehydrogenase molybdopterin binding subunit [Aureimonas populi]